MSLSPVTRSHHERRPRLLAALTAAAILAVGVTTLACSGAEGGGAQAAAAAPSVQALSGILIDGRDGKVLWSKNADRRLAPASCTKIMTALLVLERYDDLGRYVRVPFAVTLQHGAGVGLRPGDRITVEQALRAVLVRSANDAAITLACAVGRNEKGFVRLMNHRARALKLTNTHYVNCRGKPNPKHYMSARDLATLGLYAMRDARFRAIVRVKNTVIRWPPSHATAVHSHNRLLNYPWGNGIKTGATKESKNVLVGSGVLGSVPLIIVTMREPSRDQEEKDAVALLMWGWAHAQGLTVAAGQ